MDMWSLHALEMKLLLVSEYKMQSDRECNTKSQVPGALAVPLQPQYKSCRPVYKNASADTLKPNKFDRYLILC